VRLTLLACCCSSRTAKITDSLVDLLVGVRRAISPVVGEQTLRELVREAQANDQAFRARVRKVPRSSYGSEAITARCSQPVLGALLFGCNNAAHRPLMDALRAAAPLRAARADPLLRPRRPGADRRRRQARLAGSGHRWPRAGGTDPV
jgi:hypothetical protein